MGMALAVNLEWMKRTTYVTWVLEGLDCIVLLLIGTIAVFK